MSDTYLVHYGVKGMRWGHRKAQPASDLDNKRAAYKTAKKEYSKAYNKAYNYSSAHPISQYTSKKRKAESDKRWDDAITKADAANKAKDAYKKAKVDHKAAKKQSKQTINNNNSKPKDKIDTYFDKTKKNATARKVGYGMTVAGTVLESIGRKQYNQYKNGSTPGRTAGINAAGYGGRALQAIGSATVIGSQIKQVSDYNKYWK